MKPLAPNTLLQNRYLIVHLIGKGGMGEVYLAVDQRLGSAVALKRTFFSDDETLGTAFEREARTLARLRHPVLPKVSDHFTENEMQYLVMEHITGDDLSKRLETSGKPFPLNWVLFWADQLLDALAYLHGHEPPIVHRDIKPQNLKLTDENHIVLLDFGLAKNSIGNTRFSSTTGGSIVGYTPHYAPMEQIRGTGTNPRSDIYSFSATFYQLLTDTVPADALSRADSVLSNSPDPARPISELNNEISKGVSDVFMKGMGLSMDQRYSSAREMQKALREAYSEMQNQMAAQTMAFNTPAVLAGSQSQPITQTPPPPTGDYPASNSALANEQTVQDFSSQPQQQTSPSAFDSYANNKAETIPTPSPVSGGFESGNDYDSSGGSFGEKTAVMPFEKLPKAEDYQAKSGGNDFQSGGFADNQPPASTKDFNADESIPPLVSFPTQDDAGKTTAASPGSYDSQPKTASGYSPSDNTVAAAPQNFAGNQAGSSYANEPVNTPIQPIAPAQKKSGGKGLAVAGVLGGLLLLLVAAGAVAWFALKPKEETVTPKPSPVVEATPTAAPSVEPSVEPTVQANTENTNSSNSDVTTNVPEEKPENPTTSQSTPQRSAQPTVQPTRAAPTPRVVTAKTPAPTTVKTPAPAKTPAKSSRTDILQ